MTRRRRYWVLTVLALIAGVNAVWLFKPVGREFDRAVWHDQSRIHSGARQGMADRLIARGTLMGMSRGQVIDMLGPPEERSRGGWIFYKLGPERRLISVDGEMLLIELDQHDKVVACRIIST